MCTYICHVYACVVELELIEIADDSVKGLHPCVV